MKRKFIALFMLVSLFSMACSLSAVTSLLPFNRPLFEDDFSDPQSGWTTWDDGASLIAYEEEALHFYVNRPQTDYWSVAGKSYADAALQVSAFKRGGSDNNDFGLMCRYQDRDNAYLFLISSDGYYGILKVLDGEYYLLTGRELQASEAIKQGDEWNELRAECEGERLALYVNETLLAEVQDSSFSDGDVGVFAGSYDEPGVDILFDDFTVLKP